MKTIGFIGLGVMGEAMCSNLLKRGSWPVRVFDLSQDPVARVVALGASAAATAAEIVQACDAVITCLPGGAQVEAVLGGEDGLVARSRQGQLFIDMSTSPPDLMRRLDAAAAARGAALIDAPIARTRQAAQDGTLAIMVGAREDADYDRVLPLLSVMGSDVIRCGTVGAGQAAKILNNMVLFQTVMALAEALCIAEGNGFDPQGMAEAMMLGSGDSFALRNHGLKSLLPQTYPERAFSVRYAAKDLSYARRMAEAAGLRADGAEAVAHLFEDAIAAGDGDLYFPVIRRRVAAGPAANQESDKP
jgi:3-hydroxyisobutyrate dehydrogenase-like beta-hydroxyacid dehydrogenase